MGQCLPRLASQDDQVPAPLLTEMTAAQLQQALEHVAKYLHDRHKNYTFVAIGGAETALPLTMSTS